MLAMGPQKKSKIQKSLTIKLFSEMAADGEVTAGDDVRGSRINQRRTKIRIIASGSAKKSAY